MSRCANTDLGELQKYVFSSNGSAVGQFSPQHSPINSQNDAPMGAAPCSMKTDRSPKSWEPSREDVKAVLPLRAMHSQTIAYSERSPIS